MNYFGNIFKCLDRPWPVMMTHMMFELIKVALTPAPWCAKRCPDLIFGTKSNERPGTVKSVCGFCIIIFSPFPQRTLRENLLSFIFRTGTGACPYNILNYILFLHFYAFSTYSARDSSFLYIPDRHAGLPLHYFSIIPFSFISLRSQRTLRENLLFFIFRTGTGACPYNIFNYTLFLHFSAFSTYSARESSFLCIPDRHNGLTLHYVDFLFYPVKSFSLSFLCVLCGEYVFSCSISHARGVKVTFMNLKIKFTKVPCDPIYISIWYYTLPFEIHFIYFEKNI